MIPLKDETNLRSATGWIVVCPPAGALEGRWQLRESEASDGSGGNGGSLVSKRSPQTRLARPSQASFLASELAQSCPYSHAQPPSHYHPPRNYVSSAHLSRREGPHANHFVLLEISQCSFGS